MRGPWKAVLLLASALASADWVTSELHNDEFTSTILEVPISGVSESPDLSTVLSFRVDVVAADSICGPRNLSINGQELMQEDAGKGSLIIEGKNVVGSWMFSCLHGYYGPHAQRLDFNVLFVDGKPIEDVSFWVEFQQTEGPEILSASWFTSDITPGIEASGYEDDVSFEDSIDLENFDFEREMAQLEWMKDLMEDLKYQIFMKEESMALYLSEDRIKECDSLKCVIRTLYSKVRVTAHSVVSNIYSKLVGEIDPEGEGPPGEKSPPGKRPPHRKPHFPFPHPYPHPHGNHSHHNHTCPGKGNHTHPFPRPPPPPPFCRCPPHRGPPHHGPPGGPPGKHPGPPPPHDGPPGRHPGPPHGKPHGPPPPPPPPPGEGPPPPPPGSPLPPPSMEGPPRPQSGGSEGFPFDNPHIKWRHIKTAVKYFAVVTLLLIFVAIFLRRCCCCCSAARRKAKQARREEKLRRRALRRAAHRHAWKAWFARHIYRSSTQDDLDEEEKRAMLAGPSTEGQEDAVASEICEFRNAFNVVSAIVEAEEGRHARVSIDSRSSLPEYMSELGGEALPTYEIGDGTEFSSVVADGFRYTPGSSEYTPGHSTAGGVSDILGDVKE